MNLGQDINQAIHSLTKHAAQVFSEGSGIGPVALEHAANLSQDLGYPIFVKREDTVDSFGCGNKLRKLHYVIEKAKYEGADTLITVGSLPSNQCKAVAKIAHLNGMRAHLIYGGDKQHKPLMAQGSYLITTLFNPQISWFEYSSWMGLEEKLAAITEQEISAGYKPYVIRSGASDWPGILGSIELGIELGQQLHRQGHLTADIVCAAGSAGTAVGLQMAAELLNLDYRIHGMCIGEPAESLLAKAVKLRGESYAALKLEPPLPKPLALYNYGLGKAYDTPTIEELEKLRSAILRYDLVLDHNYMLKAFIGMETLLHSGLIPKNNPVVLIHSGGQTGLFDNNAEMVKWYCNKYKSYIG